jgi:Immunity protein Imm1
MPGTLVERIAAIAAEPVVFDPADRRRELTVNTWSLGAATDEHRTAQASQVVAAVREVMQARRRHVLHGGVDGPATFYVWHDSEARHLRLSATSCTPSELPLDADVRLVTLEEVVFDWLRTGSGLVPFSQPDVRNETEMPEPPAVVLPVFAARLEPWTLDERRSWWKTRGASEMRELLLLLWERIGDSDAEAAHHDYDRYGERLSRLLADGAGKEQLTSELAAARDQMGLAPATEDRWAAEHLLAWHARSTGREPLDPCIRWNSDGVRVVRTVEGLDELLDALHERYAHRPVRASIEHPSGATLGIGVARDVSVLDFIGPAPEWPPYYVSRGDLEPADEEVDWTWGGEHSPSLRGQLIPSDVARQAARAFFERGCLLRAVRWDRT